MRAKNKGMENIKRIEQFRKENLKCKRCGSMNSYHSSKLGIMRCRQCGFEWDVVNTEEV